MPVLINFKICDNSKDCNGIDVCPIGAFFWDEKKKTITVDNDKCINCGKCEVSCPVGAIRVARNSEEYEKIKEEIDHDPRKISDLFVDRYGAEPLDPAFLISKGKFKIQIIEATQMAVVEFFSHESINCLLRSISIRELFSGLNLKFRKIKVKEDDELLKRYKVSKLPSLLVFKNGKLVGKIEGYYDSGKKKMLLEKIKQIINS